MDIRECWSVDRESFQYSTLRELIAGELENLRVGSRVWQGRAQHVKASTLAPAADIAKLIVANAFTELGDEQGDGFITTTPQAVGELQGLLDDWVSKHSGGRRMYGVIGAQSYTLRRCDFLDDELAILDEMDQVAGG